MTVVIDIECPDCGRSDPVQKRDLGTYRCTHCGAEFDRKDVVGQ